MLQLVMVPHPENVACGISTCVDDCSKPFAIRSSRFGYRIEEQSAWKHNIYVSQTLYLINLK